MNMDIVSLSLMLTLLHVGQLALDFSHVFHMVDLYPPSLPTHEIYQQRLKQWQTINLFP